MTERTAADVLGELSSAKLDDLAERVAVKLKEQEEAKANENPNQCLFDALAAKEAKDASTVQALGMTVAEE